VGLHIIIIIIIIIIIYIPFTVQTSIQNSPKVLHTIHAGLSAAVTMNLSAIVLSVCLQVLSNSLNFLLLLLLIGFILQNNTAKGFIFNF
jgi:hypothetical protein